mgnify:CR=1 FL=1
MLSPPLNQTGEATIMNEDPVLLPYRLNPFFSHMHFPYMKFQTEHGNKTFFLVCLNVGLTNRPIYILKPGY